MAPPRRTAPSLRSTSRTTPRAARPPSRASRGWRQGRRSRRRCRAVWSSHRLPWAASPATVLVCAGARLGAYPYELGPLLWGQAPSSGYGPEADPIRDRCNMQRGAAQNHQLVTGIGRVTGTNGLWHAQMKETVAVDDTYVGGRLDRLIVQE